MAGLATVQSFWSIITEIDLRPLANEALGELKIAIVGKRNGGAERLADQMRCDPARPDLESDAPLLILDFKNGQLARQADLTILLLDGEQANFNEEKNLARQLADAGKRVLVFMVLPERPSSKEAILPALPWKPRYAVYGPIDDPRFLAEKFAPSVIRLLPDKILSLGRNFPLFRIPIARYLINDTSQSNAAYSLATGLGEIVPILNIPLVVTDMIILTKNQAFLAYKLGLIFGYTTEWKNYGTEFGGVLGFGFVWRQIARLLVGLIPGFGIIPKVGIAYAGTEVVGNTVLQWYLTGRHISGKQIKGFYDRAYLQGKKVGENLMLKMPKRKPKALPASQATEPLKALPAGKAKSPRRGSRHKCPQCGKISARDASFCQYCGQHFEVDQITSGTSVKKSS